MKKTLTAITLAIVLTFGATFANAGIMVSDKPVEATCTSTDKNGIIILRDGIIILAATVITGILVSDKPSEQCVQKDGIIIL